MAVERVTIFTKILKNEEAVRESISNGEDTYSWEQLGTLQRLWMFVRSGEWSTNKSTDNLIKYIHMHAPEAAKILKKSPNTIRAQRSQASDLLECLLGDDIVEKCISKDETDRAEAIKRIEAVKNMNLIDKFIVSDLMNVSEPGKKNYKLEECSKEIKAIAELSDYHKEKVAESLNPKKVFYLLSILRQPTILKEFDGNAFNVQKAELLSALVDAEKELRSSSEA